MPGRKKPDMTEQERDMQYVRHNKREGGVNIQGDEGEFLNYKGAAGQVRAEREQWQGAPKFATAATPPPSGDEDPDVVHGEDARPDDAPQ